MNAFLKGYQRITCAEACGLGDVDLRHVTVWFRRAKKWEQHRAVDLLKGQDASQSICRALVTRLYGWTPWQYESFRDTFDDASSKDVMGIYANRQGQYAIVGRLPVSDRLVRGAIGIGGIMTGVGGMLLKDHLKEKPSDDAQEGMLRKDYLTENPSDDAQEKGRQDKEQKERQEKELQERKEEILDLQLKLVYDLLPKFAYDTTTRNTSEYVRDSFSDKTTRTSDFDKVLEGAIQEYNQNQSLYPNDKKKLGLITEINGIFKDLGALNLNKEN
jgi:hypothetical protein